MRHTPTHRPVEAAPVMHTAHKIDAAGIREGLMAVVSLVALPAVRPGGAARMGPHGG